MTVNHVYQISLLNPDNDAVYNSISETTMHDLGIDALCKVITEDAKEEQMIMRVMGKVTSSPETATYRQDVFDDILNLPQVREKLLDLIAIPEREFIDLCIVEVDIKGIRKLFLVAADVMYLPFPFPRVAEVELVGFEDKGIFFNNDTAALNVQPRLYKACIERSAYR